MEITERETKMLMEDVNKYAKIDEKGNIILDSGIQSQIIGKVKETEQKLIPLTISDYFNYKPNNKYIIKDWLYPSENGMIFGQSGSLKSLFLMHQAICIAKGKKYLGKYPVKQQPVLILSAENSKKTDKKRIMRIMKGERIRNKHLPFYVLPRSQCGNILDLDYLTKIRKLIEEKNIKLIYLDTINPLSPEIDDNSARDVTYLFNNFLKPLVDKYDLTIIFLHHTDKRGKDFLGSTKWFGNSDLVWKIERNETKNILTLKNEKNRDGEQTTKKISVEFSKTEIKLKLLEESSSEMDKKKKMTQLEFFILKMDKFCNKNFDRKEIYETLKQKGVIFKKDKSGKNSTLERAIKEWREK